ncbi:ABC transporter ATP-binding protein [Spirochaeta thermophila]|uniref:Putative oligopeptide/dipeptide ABC transporter, ATP binding protein n=1 Tax=Winmispira thermophila (strain ATCC 49972 / DSM 6192 / RI 19.B1) TaxID=665571 RepID=E0RNZ8_WINT6|nr:ABC transporter ATP-binding protein [Spirochaeta thermophila]ADN02660.1 putative oligopeptide/dipeptide ABC transporter, ATP binding protein [Spirochaeta thermophila DSM 6192]
MLELQHVSKIYRIGAFGRKTLRAVDDVSFDIEDGEVVSLIGESGSGKTTIGKMILRLIGISEGKILFDGKDISLLKGASLKEYYRHVQGVFQDPFSSYNPIFKADRIFSLVKEEFYPSVPASEWKEKVEGALRAVGLNPPDVLNKYPHQLSGGQLQRFLIARALLLDVKFLVADEIISMLDASTRVDVLNLIGDLKARGLSVLFITHDLALGYYIGDKAVIMYKGKVVEMGSTEKVYHETLHPYTKMLMAAVPRLDEKWEDVELRLKEQAGDGSLGCPYYGRCPVAEDRCRVENPPLHRVDEDHWVACWKYYEGKDG